MAASGKTPIQLYRTSTASAAPAAGDLAAGELCINTTDEKLYFKNAAGTVKLLASNSGSLGSVTSVDASGGTTGLTFSGGPVTSSGTLTLSGTLGVANGGTGATSLTSGYLVKGNGTSAASASVVYDNGTNVGIGTSSPSDTFTVNGTIGGASNFYLGKGLNNPNSIEVGDGRTGSNYAFIDLIGDTTYSDYGLRILRGNGGPNTFSNIYHRGTGSFEIGAIDAAPVIFLTSGAERARIDSNGNVGIGTSSPSYKLQVVGASGSNQVAYFVNTSAGSSLGGIVASIENGGNNTNSYHFAGVTQSVALWYLYGNGTTSYTSDIRVKKNVTTTRDGYLEDVCKLRVVKYNWYNDSDDTPRELGFIAQEVEQVFPGLVQDAMHPTKDGEIHKVLKGSVMMPIMLKALQEANAKIDALAARVAQLEGK